MAFLQNWSKQQTQPASNCYTNCVSVYGKAVIGQKTGKSRSLLFCSRLGIGNSAQTVELIALISHTSKILLLIIVDRFKRKLEFEQPEEQAGYRKERGTRDMLVCLQVLMEKIIAIDGKVFITSIDYSKAFDSVSQCKLFESFLEMGFPKHLVAFLKSLYLTK